MTSNLEREIAEQPEALARLVDREAERAVRLVAGLPEFHYALIAGRGTSDHAATYAKYAWGAVAGVPVALAAPSLYTLAGTPPRMGSALVVGISQSGQSPDIVAVLDEARHQRRPTLAITNDAASPLAAAADHVVQLHAGVEHSVAATKTYTAQLTAVALIAAALGSHTKHLGELRELPEAVAAPLKAAAPPAVSAAQRLRDAGRCVVIGRGYHYATALELGLKLKELTGTDVGAYSAADFRHGPFATVDESTVAILVMPEDSTFSDMSDLASQLHARGAQVVPVPHASTGPRPLAEWLTPVPAIVAGQLLALHLTHLNGLDPDNPPGLRKVTRTF